MSQTTKGPTPGPWEWYGDTLEGPASTEAPSYGCVIDLEVTCGAYCQGGTAVMEISIADRRLIAAAPELLEALEACVDRLEAWMDGEKHAQVRAESEGDRHAAEQHYHAVGNYMRLANRARAAIQKARGTTTDEGRG